MRTARIKVCCAPGCPSRQTVESRGIPPGWFSVMQAAPDSDSQLIGHGIYCSTACVLKTLGAIPDGRS